jgi:two-component system response regulator MtrA
MLNDTVLVICDNPKMSDIWGYILSQLGLFTLAIDLNQDVVNSFIEHTFDLILIDLYDCELDPLPLISNLRGQIAIPILLLLPCQDETPILAAYKTGADECVIKPVSPALLQAKVQSWLNRSWTIPATILDTFQVGEVQLSPAQRQFIDQGGTPIKLTNLEFRLLHLLMSHPGQMLEGDFIIGRVWGYYGEGNSALLKNVIYRLRRKIEPDPTAPRYILSSTREGYLFQP